MNKINVAVMFGGISSEHSISVLSAKNIMNAMNKDKYIISPIYISEDGNWYLYTGELENIEKNTILQNAKEVIFSVNRSFKGFYIKDNMEQVNLDVAFPVMHGKNGEDGTIQGLFEIAGIPYAGCDIPPSVNGMDKSITKILVDSIGVGQAKFVLAVQSCNYEQITKEAEQRLGYPMFVKPCKAGSSVGVSKASNKEQLHKALDLAFESDDKVLIEEAIVGRELECAVLGNFPEAIKPSVLGEIVTSGNHEFYDFDAKYIDDTETKIVDDVDDRIIKEIQENAIKIFNVLNGKGLSRVDFFLEEGTNRILFNEINTLPGFTNISMYPTLMTNTLEISYSELIDEIIKLAMK